MIAKEGVGSPGRSARIAGVLFIIATTASIMSMVLLGSLLDEPDSLARVGVSSARVIAVALTDLAMVTAMLAGPVALFPTLKRQSAGSVLGYLLARFFEAVPIVVGAISLRLLVTLGRESLAAGATSAPFFQALGTLLLAARDWTDIIGTQIVFSLPALILNYALLRSRLVPVLISIWGLVGALLILAAGLLSLFGLIATPVLAASHPSNHTFGG
mgnify:CR=1 FL=1